MGSKPGMTGPRAPGGESPILVTYTFTYGADRRQIVSEIKVDPVSVEHVTVEGKAPEWARLGFHQCRGCPLVAHTNPHCPAALSLIVLVEQFRELLSFTDVEVLVTTPHRSVHRRTTVQKALSSLMGLYMATSGCPILGYLKPMARFHLPFATRDETVFRAVGAYLTGQYFLRKAGAAADLDLDGLRDLYRKLHDVNVDMSNRLRHVSGGDASINAVILLDLFAQELPYSIDDNLSELQHLFAPFLNESGSP